MKLELTHHKSTMGAWGSVTIADEHDNTVFCCDLTDAGKIAWSAAQFKLVQAGYSIWRGDKCVAGSLEELLG